MIARQAPSLHICLQCQRRLAQRCRSSYLQRAYQSTALGTERAQFDATSRQISSKGNALPKPTRKPLAQTRQRLAFDRFGKPADVLVLRESKITKYDPSIYLKNLPNPEEVDILARLNDERGLATEEEVARNIDEFRPAAGNHPRDRKRFNALIRSMQDAFTTPQLERYIKSFPSRNASQADIAISSSSPSMIPESQTSPDHKTSVLRRSSWVAEEIDLYDYLARKKPSMRGYALASHTRKQQVLVYLLRECWKLELRDVASKKGHLEVRVRPGDLDVLLLKSTTLDGIRDEYLGKRIGAIETSRKEGIIKIIGSEARCYKAIEQIDLILQNIYRLTLNLRDLIPVQSQNGSPQTIRGWIDNQFDDQTLLELSEVTTTSIKKLSWHSPQGQKKFPIIISCMTNPKDPWLSNRAMMARRLIVSTLSSDRTYRLLGCKSSQDWQNGRFTNFQSTGLPWNQSFRSWTRWMRPIAKPSVENGENEDSLGVDTLDADVELLREEVPPGLHTAPSEDLVDRVGTEPQSMEKTYQEDDIWSEVYQFESSAKLGSILHQAPSSGSHSVADHFQADEDAKSTFSSALPALSRSLRGAELNRRNTNGVMVLRFRPSPFYVDPKTNEAIGSSVLSAFPTLEMHLDVVEVESGRGPVKELSYRTMIAVVQEKESDLMLPSEVVDLRFSERTISRIAMKKRDHPAIRDFLAASNLTYESRRMDMNPTLTMPISKHLCRLQELERLGFAAEDLVHNVEYLFVDFELRETMTFAYEDWTAAFTYINGGRPGSKRSELSIRPIKSNRIKGTQDQFLATLLAMVKSLGDFSPGPLISRPNLNYGIARFVVISDKLEGPMPKLLKMKARRLCDVFGDFTAGGNEGFDFQKTQEEPTSPRSNDESDDSELIEGNLDHVLDDQRGTFIDESKDDQLKEGLFERQGVVQGRVADKNDEISESDDLSNSPASTDTKAV
ncbi:mitochondrial inner-membrane-bound regulator-domain-containing protein [Amylocarpus encephaloides]|uniref:Mitochondrial inner-membrane-bound regulator-domain-containing protein n=1 Tax=Amylocarpus encephaloides TaxID=45428 RepID=A0A9P7Y8K9_9HELO|nr:mitochondrial inner-membrane-bound regulator-domain-containing protein [Amylocarpus encephaloides]